MVTPEELEARRAELARGGDLAALVARGRARTARLLTEGVAIPEAKALLSTDGGVCPADGAALEFDPWRPGAHRCPRCGAEHRGERHDRWWVKWQHLWLAERAAELAAIAGLAQDAPAAARAREILSGYGERYLRYPNRDNVLGPSRLFFSTYLESIWLLSYLGAAQLLAAAGALDDATRRAVHTVADEAANLIGDFDEGFSNRQTWNDAALAAIAVWFEDEALARRAIESETGLIAHLRGYRADGMWYEGENYHLFALRGLLLGAEWAAHAGVDFLAEPDLAAGVTRALLAPARTALPDFTFPARQDSRFGMSLAHPMYVEGWEVALGRAVAAGATDVAAALAGWLRALYGGARPEAVAALESYVHEAGMPAPPAGRGALSWWALVRMAPVLPEGTAWNPASLLMEDQGLAILRRDARYVSLECGPAGSGHAHPDRLHLTVHANGVHWLRDFGTGSYVARDLFWYRSTLAHNAPLFDGASQPPADALCECFQVGGDWEWARGRWAHVTRTIVAGPAYLLDVLERRAGGPRTLELPWHVAGGVRVETPGHWEAADRPDEFLTGVERFVPDAPGTIVARAGTPAADLVLHFQCDGELLRAEAPGEPGRGVRESFLLWRAQGPVARLVTVIEPCAGPPAVRAVRRAGDTVEVDTASGTDRHVPQADSWIVESPAGRAVLRGIRPAAAPRRPLLDIDLPRPAEGVALRLGNAPALDGTLEGFDTMEPLALDGEDQYRRSEEPWAGPDEFSATAWVNWGEEGLYVAVEVRKPEVMFRPAAAAPLRLDNEPDDIHSDGLQLYVRMPERDVASGYLVIPEGEARGGVRVRPVEGTGARATDVTGRWTRTPAGYRVTLAVRPADWARAHLGARVGFDLIINEMAPGRVRRAGQLVWSGGGGWVWLRGDRQDPERLGVLELVT